MGNLQNNIYIEYEQKVGEIEGLEDTISVAENVTQVQRFINYKLKPKYQHEKEWCDFFGEQFYNKYWHGDVGDHHAETN
tara:strand:- start:4900 stop:5136 length:237 start_codon:yes stop_codon:yes gene_type:complete